VRKFLGLIFDFNGVLWWDSHLQEQAWRQFSQTLRGTPFSSQEMQIHVHGRNNKHTLEYLLGRAVEGTELEHLIQRKEKLYQQLCLAQGAAFGLSPGAVELLAFLTAAQIPHTIATASGKNNLDFFAVHLALDCWFDLAQIVYDDGSRPGKPAPDIYLQAAHNLGLAPADCVVIEDARSGIQAARAAGIGYIIALGPQDRHAALAQLAGVSQVVQSLAQIPTRALFV